MVNEHEFMYDPKAQAMVFTTGTRRHIRAVYNDGKVWYCASDIARLIGYRDPSKAINSMDCEVRILHVPHVSENRRGITTCNCIGREDVIRFISQQRAFPEVRSWIRDVVIPQAERQLTMTEEERSTERAVVAPPETKRIDDVLVALDRIILEAAMLKQKLIQ